MTARVFPAPGLLVAIVDGIVTEADIDDITNAVEAHAKNSGGPIAYVLVVPEATSTPTEAVRQRATAATRRLLQGAESRFDIVVAAGGVIASMQRVVMRGLILALPERRLITIHGDIGSALRMVCRSDAVVADVSRGLGLDSASA